MSGGTAAELLAEQLTELETRQPLSDDPEELHKARVATRRSRAIIKAMRPIWGDGMEAVREELRWLGRLLGAVRDLDVLIAHIHDQQQSLDGDGPAAGAIVAAFEHERLAARADLAEALDSTRYRGLLVAFEAALAGLPDHDDDLRPVADKALRKLRKAAKELSDDPTDEELHAVRIRAKKARYTAELAGGKRRERRVERLKELQDVVGEHQDAVVAEERLRSVASDNTAVAAGRLIERERERKAARRAAYPKVLKAALKR
jgi:CHAD domain-containing protein